MDKHQFLDSMKLTELRDRLKASIAKVAATREKVTALRTDLRGTDEEIELRRARLIQTEDYRNGKNAEIREAWLTEQSICDEEYRRLSIAQDDLKRSLARAEDELDNVEREYSFAKRQYEMAGNVLRFMAD